MTGMPHLGALATTVIASSPLAAGGYAIREGEAHPDFVLPSVRDTRPVALSQFRGKKVLLIHFSSW